MVKRNSLMISKISSLQNPLIKKILRMQDKPGERKSEKLMIVEGTREISLAINAGFQFKTMLVCREILERNVNGEQLTDPLPADEVLEITIEVYNRLAYRQNAQGIIGLAITRENRLEGLPVPSNPLYLVLETVEKPGNLGAILRTADAAGITGVIICDPQTDLYNPNVIRSGIGCIFTVPVAVSSSPEAIRWMKNKNITIFGTALTATNLYHKVSYLDPAAIVMGSEAGGLSSIWLEQCDQLIRIPMRGRIDSMNVSVSAAIVVFEACRQRNFT